MLHEFYTMHMDNTKAQLVNESSGTDESDSDAEFSVNDVDRLSRALIQAKAA